MLKEWLCNWELSKTTMKKKNDNLMINKYLNIKKKRILVVLIPIGSKGPNRLHTSLKANLRQDINKHFVIFELHFFAILYNAVCIV